MHYLSLDSSSLCSCCQIGVILNVTSYYAESGGQTFDTGSIVAIDSSGAAAGGEEDEEGSAPAKAVITVTNVQSFAGSVHPPILCSVDELLVLEAVLRDVLSMNVCLDSFVLHVGTVESGSVKVGDTVQCRVDYDRRTDIAPNHTMTHALNYALRKVNSRTLHPICC